MQRCAAMPHLLGYARVSTAEQHPDLQLDALRTAGCYRLFVDTPAVRSTSDLSSPKSSSQA